MTATYTLDEVVERIGKAMQQMDGDDLANIYNQDFGDNIVYLGDGEFKQDDQSLTSDELIERISRSLLEMDGKAIAEFYNREFGYGMSYLGDSLFEQSKFES